MRRAPSPSTGLGLWDPTELPGPVLHAMGPHRRYLLIVREVGGWARLQALLRALRAIADRAGEGVSIASLAVAWVLSRPAVGAAIVGARGQGRIDATVACAGLRIPAELLDECTAAAEATLQPVPGDVCVALCKQPR